MDGGAVNVWVIPGVVAGAKNSFGYGADFFALADRAFKDSVVWFDFGKDAAAAGEKTYKARLSPLHARVDGIWASETGCMGYGHFGTLQDEIETYKRWGWKGWDDKKKETPAHAGHSPHAYVATEDIHFETEADTAENGLLMYLRTGDRGWFDAAEAWARFYKTHMIPREGREPFVKGRKNAGLGFGLYGPKEYYWLGSRVCRCHAWGCGLFDYYCLTGDTDALEAGLTLARKALSEAAPSHKPDAVVAGKTPLGLGRVWGRHFMNALRAYQVTRSEETKMVADLFAQWAVKAPNKHPSGLFVSQNGAKIAQFVEEWIKSKKGESRITAPCKKYLEEEGIKYEESGGSVKLSGKNGDTWSVWDSCQSFEFVASVDALSRCAEVTGDPEIAQVVAGLARGAREYYLSKKCEQGIPHPFIGFPKKDRVFDPGAWDPKHAKCPGDGGPHNGYHTRYLTDVFSHAYSLTGDKEWLDWAKKAWDRGSKRGYGRTEQSYPPDEVGVFAYQEIPKGAKNDIRYCSRMFYEVPRAKQ